MADWFESYKGLFGDPAGAQQSFKTETPKATGASPGYLYWRNDNMGDKRFAEGTGEAFMKETNVPPGWAQALSEQTRTAQPGSEFGGKAETMMDYLKAVAEGRKSASLEEGALQARQAQGAAQGRLASGPWSTAAQRAVGLQGGQAQMGIGAEAAKAAVLEKQQAQQAYMAAVDAQRQQDIGAELALEELARRYREMGLSDEQARAAALRQYASDMISRYGIYSEGKAKWDEHEGAQTAAIAGMIGTGIGTVVGGMAGGPLGAAAGGSVGGMAGKGIGSDKRLKAGIKSADKDMAEFLGALGARKWAWKADGKPDVGIIAQDLEKTPVGRHIMEPTEQGMKGFTAEPKRFNPVVLASLAHIDKRLRKLEK